MSERQRASSGSSGRVRWMGAWLLGAALFACASPPKGPDPREMAIRRAQAHFDMAIDHNSQGRVEAALSELLAAERLDPNNPRIHHGLAHAYIQKGRAAEAEQHYLKALAIRPDYHDARFNLAALYCTQERWAQCSEQSRILLDDPTFAAMWRAETELGWAEYRLGNVENARRLIQTALDRRALYRPAVLRMGIIEAEQGRHVEAVGYFQSISDQTDEIELIAEVKYRLGLSLAALGDRQQAELAWRSVVSQAPRSPWARQAEAALQGQR